MTITSNLLEALLSPDSTQRQAGEEYYQQLGLQARIEGLLMALQNESNPAHVVQLIAVLLRREILQLSDTQQLKALVQPLVACCSKHSAGIGDCLAEICASLQVLDANLSVSVTQSVLQASNAASLWRAVADRAPQSFARSRMWTTLPTTDHATEWLALVVAAAVAIPQDQVVGFQQHLAAALPMLAKGEPRVWELLVQASEDVPLLMDGNMLQPMLEFCAADPCLLSVQVIVNLLSQCIVAGTVNTHAVLVAALSTCWKELEDIEDEEDHHAQSLVSELLLFPRALEILQPEIEKAIQHGEWRRALLALQCCMEGAPVSFQQHFGIATKVAVEQVVGTEAYQAVRLLGLICEVGSNIEEQPVLQALAHAANHADTRVALLACRSLVSYCRPTDDETERSTSPFLADILQALSSGPMQSQDVDVRIAAVGAIACWAQATGQEFAPFYSRTVPQLLSGTQSPDDQLNEACLEAATIIGQAVPELFAADAHRIMESIIPCLQEKAYMLPSCARIASVLGESYMPYLSQVLPILLARASTTDDVEVSEGAFSSLGRRNDLESATVAIPGKGLTKVTLNTTLMQEKSQVIRSVYEHAVALGADFGPYCARCCDVLVPLIHFQFSSDIRGTAAQTMGAVLDASCKYMEMGGDVATPKRFLPILLQAISGQLVQEEMWDIENVHALADALSETACAMYSYAPTNSELIGSVTQTEVSKVVEICMKLLVSCLARRAKITMSMKEALSEDERFSLSTKLDQEEDLLVPLVDTVGYTLKTYRESFVPIFKTFVVPTLSPFLSTGDDIRARLSAVCLFDDCVEFCGSAAAATFAPMLLQGIQNGLDDSKNGGDDELKRAAIYGVAQIARYAPREVLNPVAQSVIQLLASIATSSLDHEAPVYENSISALASLVLFQSAPFVGSGFVKRELVLNAFLESLPLSEDPDEAKICHSGFCDLLERGLIAVDSRTEGIVCGVLSLLEDGEEVADQNTCTRLQQIRSQLQGGGLAGDRFSSSNVVSP